MSSGMRSSTTEASISLSIHLIVLRYMLMALCNAYSHASHHLVAIYAMGAAGPLIEAAYQTHVVYMKPAFESPEKITEENFWKHLGKRE